MLVPVAPEQSGTGAPSVEVDHHFHHGDVDQRDQHTDSQGQGALNSAGLGKSGKSNTRSPVLGIIYFVWVTYGGVIAVEATVEGLNVTKLEDGGGDPEYEEGETVGEDGSHCHHHHIRTDSLPHSALLSLSLSQDKKSAMQDTKGQHQIKMNIQKYSPNLI